MSAVPRVVVVGDVITDVVAMLSGPLATGSDTAAGIRFSGGGQAANTAAWLAGQGAPVTLVAAVGDDETGRERVAELTRIGVDCVVQRHEGYPTGTVIVLTHDGERTMVSQRGANLRLTAEHVDEALAAAPDAGHLHLSAYTLLDVGSRGAGLRALAAARARGLTVSVDAASAAPLRRVGGAFLTWVRDVDLLLVNTDEATVLAGGLDPAAQGRALTAVAHRVVVKRGAAGAVWVQRGGGPVEFAPAPGVDVVDVTGAGDAFAAGLLTAWLAGADPRAALARAGDLGALAVTTVGARPSAGQPG
ncbi:carbohydrate kinase family protein [Micromonospora sp. DT31]|uniref:carbohydrate kinase family protein n=1 Tax=Micromonospora sp. DT31 TaxID=3393434 RepID=UPI003CEDA675